MKVCDKCKTARKLESIKIKGKNYELCDDCSLRITEWIGKEESKSTFDKIFNR